MVVIEDAAENQFLQRHIDSHFKNEAFWIGLEENGPYKYIWVDKSSLEFGKVLNSDPWKNTEPNRVNIIISIVRLSFCRFM